MEVWKAVPEWEDLYLVSNYGRVKSKERVVKGRTPKGKLFERTKPGRIRKLQVRPRDGYVEVMLHRKGNRKMYKVHRLVAAAFIGPSDLDVNHIDGDKSNNHVDNLEYVTRRGNIYHAIASENHCGKLSMDEAQAIRTLYATGKYLQRELAEMFDVTRSSIGHIVQNRSYVD